MTAKEKLIQHLHEARIAHIRWVNSIKLLISGIEIDESHIELNPTEAPFGRWLYAEASLFGDGNSKNVLDDIESIFLALHDHYMKIYPIYYRNKKKGMIEALLGSKKSVSAYESEFSQRQYEEIVQLSDRLKQKLKIFETQLISLGEEKFESVAKFTEHRTAPQPEPLPAEEKGDAYFYGTRGRH